MAEKDYYGDMSTASVPKKAIQAQDIIYQASTLMSVSNQAGIPFMTVNDTLYKEDATRGRVGEDDVQMDAGFDHTRLTYKQMKTNLIWTIYPYLIPDGAKLQSRDFNTLFKDQLASASEYFASIKDCRILTELRAANGTSSTAAAAALWSAANADIEGDIITGLQYIVANSNVQTNEKYSIVVPAKVSFEVKKLTLIQNIQRTMQNYLEDSFNLKFLAYRAMLDDAGSAVNDGLSTSALLFVQGKNTAKGLIFNTAEAARRQIPLVEHSRIHGRGDAYSQKMATGALATWDCVNTYSETRPLTNRIYEITTVTS